MHANYRDIIGKLGEPRWWDEHAVPRYCEFSPDRVANIYATEVALAEIACQSCGHRFRVAFSWSQSAWINYQIPRLSEILCSYGELDYGDPPNLPCCPAGPTMMSDPVGVIEFWKRDGTTKYEWKRDKTLEGVAPLR